MWHARPSPFMRPMTGRHVAPVQTFVRLVKAAPQAFGQ